MSQLIKDSLTLWPGERPPRSPGVDPKQLAAELQKVSQQQGPSSGSSSLPATTSATSSPAQPGSPSVGKKRHSSKASLRAAEEKKNVDVLRVRSLNHNLTSLKKHPVPSVRQHHPQLNMQSHHLQASASSL